MRFKTTLSKTPLHKEFVCCVGWNTTEDIYSCGDDHVLMKWNLITKETTKVADLPNDLFPMDLHWFPRSQTASRKQGSDLMLITSADGKFHFVNKTGRIEKSVDAHVGATLAGSWSYDGAGLLTAGEDGQLKVWSRSGMLRSTVVQAGQPIYAAVWGPDSNQVLHTLGNSLVIKPLTSNSKANKWKAHDGLILKVAWNPSNNMILSGGEDCCYKIWDTYGRMIFTSTAHDYPITALSWAPAGDLFAVGAFNTLRLCDKAGWSHSLARPNTGSILGISWSSDGTQVAGACGNGHVILGHIVERRLEWSNLEATVSSRRKIRVRDVSADGWEDVEVPDRVIKLALGHGKLVVALPQQCYIFDSTHWNTPSITELREGSVSMIVLAQKHFLLAEQSSVSVLGYDGRLLCTPRWPNMRLETLSESLVSLTSDVLAVRDQANETMVHLFGVGRQLTQMPPLVHNQGVVEMALSETGPISDRYLALVDKNRDLYIVAVGSGASRKASKLGPMIDSLCWNNETNMLAAVQDGNITVWYYPTVVFVDKSLIPKTALVRDGGDFGKNPSVVNFVGSLLSVRRSDGTLMYMTVPPYFAVLHGFVAEAKWDNALRLCRSAKNDILWACLGAMSTSVKNLTAAEESYAAIDEFDKVKYIQEVKALGSRSAQLAMMTLLSGNIRDAETQLLQNGLVFRAIMINLELHHWTRALELAMKHKTHVDTVLFYRMKYLEMFDKVESDEKFLQFKDEMELDGDTIEKKVKLEYERENAVR